MNGLRLFTVLFLPSIISAQRITNNTLFEERFACPGREVVLTCEVQRFDILAWTSEVLIGSGGEQISFSTEDQQGIRRNSSLKPSTYAILTVNDNEKMHLVSQLHVTVPSDVSDISVMCNNVVNSTSTTKSFTVLGQPNVPQNVFASQQECKLDKFTRCLNTYYWHYSPMNATQAGVNNYSTILNGTMWSNCTLNASAFTSNQGNRVSSLVCEQDCAAHVLSVSAVNICGREGERSSDLVLNPEERISIHGICVILGLSGAAYQNCALTMLLMAVLIAVNFAQA